VSLFDAFRKAVCQAVDDDVLGLAAELAYRATLAVLPFLLFLAALPSVAGSAFGVQDVGERLSGQMDALLSEKSADMMRTLIDEVERSRGVTALVLGALGTLWAGTSATSAFRKALNRLYKFDERATFLQRKATEIGMTLIVGSFFVLAFAVVLVGPAAMGGVNALTQLVSLVLAFVLVLLAVSLLYWKASAGEAQYRWVTPGAVLFGLAWLTFTFLFSAYLSLFGGLNHVYGTLGAMIALLVWLYGSNIALLLGAELNSVLGHDVDPNVQRNSVEPRR
jgi:membrane protein